MQQRESGVSETIAVVLMVAMVVLLAAVAYPVLTRAVDQLPEEAAMADISVSMASVHTPGGDVRALAVAHLAGDGLDLTGGHDPFRSVEFAVVTPDGVRHTASPSPGLPALGPGDTCLILYDGQVSAGSGTPGFWIAGTAGGLIAGPSSLLDLQDYPVCLEGDPAARVGVPAGKGIWRVLAVDTEAGVLIADVPVLVE